MTFMKQFKPHRCLKTNNWNWHVNSSNKGNFFDPYIIASIQSLKAKTILTNTIVQIAPATVSLLNLFLILMLNRLQLIWISSISEVNVSSKTYVFMKYKQYLCPQKQLLSLFKWEYFVRLHICIKTIWTRFLFCGK